MVKNSSGITIIELIVVITVISLFFGAGAKLYTDHNNKKMLQAETQKLITTIESSKKRIISGDKSGLDTTCTLSGYTVIIDASSYLTYAQCPADTQVGVTYVLPERYSLSATSIGFKLFGLGSNSACTVITDSENNICQTIEVDTAGTVTYSTVQTSCTC